MKLIEWLVKAALCVFGVFVIFMLGWTLRGYKAKKEQKGG